ncbi:hypothetical protein Gogos_011891, partial [Gossypium gossypioides]|nr:hypothetical protein [Gossypium gossypioides]
MTITSGLAQIQNRYNISSRTTRSMTIASCQDGSGQTSSTPKSRNNKRKAPFDHLRTQESIVGNMSKSS